MSHSYHHAVSSAKRYGGQPEDYQEIHSWFDETKRIMADARHRALRHHAEGIFLCESIFGVTITNSVGKKVPVRLIAEQHVTEDMGGIPSAVDWLRNIPLEQWMNRPQRLQVEIDLFAPVEAAPSLEPIPDEEFYKSAI